MQKDEKTERGKERASENRKYTSVIVKRSDISKRHPDDILQHAITEGIEQLSQSPFSIFLSGLTAGLILSFAALCVAIMAQLFSGDGHEITQRISVALVYPLGFVLCILSGAQLFTEQTALAVYPVLDKKSSLLQLANNWLFVLLGNLTGTFIGSLLIYYTSSSTEVNEGYQIIFQHLTSPSFVEIFTSAILAGWLMAQGGWLILATNSSTAQILCIYVVTFIIGLAQLHHSVAGSAEMFLGMFSSGKIHFITNLSFLSAAILGNALGGSLFVAGLNYSHIKQAARKVGSSRIKRS